MSDKQKTLDKTTQPYLDYIQKLENKLEKCKKERNEWKEKAKREKQWGDEREKILGRFINNEIEKCKWYMKSLETETYALLRACEILSVSGLPEGVHEIQSTDGVVLDKDTRQTKKIKSYLISKDILKMRDYLVKQIEKEKKKNG